MKIDVHAHLFSSAYIDCLQRVFGNDSTPTGQDAQRLIRWMRADPRMIDVEGRLEEMNKWNIDMQVLSVPFHGALVQDKAAAVELTQLANDLVIQTAHKYPQRFRALLAIPLQFPDVAVQELDRIADRSEVVGVILAGSAGGRTDTSRRRLERPIDRVRPRRRPVQSRTGSECDCDAADEDRSVAR